ncbi:hypothetical protein ACIFOT_27020 [Neobacillus sp. NRS-1170]|uniref:N-acetylmuramoyl-L-alanine amidase family protein n=1 Tax=Neobacillus sp. NRS-1170 TaxID=3233898 RepID=UPI003D28218E
MRRFAAVFLALQLVLVPAVGFAEGMDSAVQTPEKTMSQKLSSEKAPKQSLKKADFMNPQDYPLIANGNFVDDLYDSVGSYHYIYFDDVTSVSSELMNVKLTYESDSTAEKDSLLTLELYKEAAGSLEFLGSADFDMAGYNGVYLNTELAKSDVSDSPYIYMRIGISKASDDPSYADVLTFKVANPFNAAPSAIVPDDRYAVISNESVDGEATQASGAFNEKNMKITNDASLARDAYKVDYNKPFDHAAYKGKLVRKSARSLMPAYKIGDQKLFWVSDLTTNTDSQINARLAYSGAKANVWVYDNQITDSDAEKLGTEFDNKIYSAVTTNFGQESDVDHDGKVNILCYDIQDGYSDTSGDGYTAGYFYSGDLYNVEHSNQSEIFYMDTYPTMGIGSVKDVTGAYETLAHEFQHMVNFNQNALIEGNSEGMDTWLDEALSMAAEQIYTGHGLSDRIEYYNLSSSISNGHSLLYWDQYGDTLANYSLSYLFGQYIKIQTGQGNRIFKEILANPNNNYKAIEDVAKKYISPDMTFGKLMTNFRIALLLKEGSGPYGFKGDPFFDTLNEKIFTGSSVNLRGGGAVVTTYKSKDGFVQPVTKGNNVSYTFFKRGQENNGVPLRFGWVLANGKWYYYDLKTSAMRTGWLQDGGKWYYLDASGVMKTGWLKDGTKWYYLAGSGAMKTGWLKDGTRWYYLDGSGAMRTGWLKDGAKWYYLDASGAMRTGWLKDAGKWYYLDRSGVMKTGWVLISGKWYKFNSSGVWVG